MNKLKNLQVFKLILVLLLSTLVFAANDKVLEASKSVIRIITVLDSKNNMASGTAFCINSNGYFLTNAHVIDGTRSIFAVKSSYKYDVKVIKKYDDLDLAILKIEDTGLEPLSFAYRNNINVTDRVSSIGFPGAADKNDDLDELTTVTINSGIIGKFTKIDLSIDPRNTTSKSPVVQHDAAVNHGNSGGPLVNECGHVVGINVQKGLSYNRSVAQIATGDVVQGIFYAIDVDITKKILNESHISFLETGPGCVNGSTSLSTNDRKYLIITAILLLLLAVWSIIFYKKKNDDIDKSALSHLINRKLGERDKKEIQKVPVNTTTVRLKPAVSGFPILIVEQVESIVGRSRSATVHLDNLQVSGKHLSLSLNQRNEIIVKDLNSLNGTYIEGRKLTPNIPYMIKQGEHLVIGSEDVVYEVL